MGELQVEAYRIEYDWEDIFIVRPANVYGTYDNFDQKNAMVIPSLIKRAMDAGAHGVIVPNINSRNDSNGRNSSHKTSIIKGESIFILLIYQHYQPRPFRYF